MYNVNFKKNILVFGSLFLAIYFVIFVWNFWSELIYALGFNLTIFILGFLFLFFSATKINAFKKNYFWVMPIILIAISFSLWENPFLKVINLLILPFLLSIFFAYSLTVSRELNFRFIFLSIMERILILTKIKEAIALFFDQINIAKGDKLKIFVRITFGILLFAVLALTIFIPLLSAADPDFAKMVDGIMKWFHKIISFRYLNRIIFAIIANFAIISYILSFRKKVTNEKVENSKEKKLIDPIISGIVLGGVLVLYLLFLFTQISHLWVNQLPINFSETERLVKSGFWQLFLLSMMNILFFFGYFRKTNNIVQNILKIFIVASLLLLFSAGYKMFLYVFYYGLSYEKFFASYAVIYFAVIFVWLLVQLFNNKEKNIFKFLVFSFLWMYSVLTIMPVERIIFSVNEKLSLRADSRINLNELQMLSYDVLPMVIAHSNDEEWKSDWCRWEHHKISVNNRKKWYEKNISNFSQIKYLEYWKFTCSENNSINSNNKEGNQAPVSETPKDDRKNYTNEKFYFSVKYPNQGWKIVNIFDMEKNRNEGTAVYKDALTRVSVLPLNNTDKIYSDAGAVFSEVTINGISGKKRVWKTDDGYFLIIQLMSYPENWEKNHIISAQYTDETKEDVEKIIDSIVFTK